jgi:hypothetical protein
MLKESVFRAGRSLATVLGAATVALTSQVAVAAGDVVAGHYRLHDGPDVASELVLRPDGRFDYFLAAGSLDEQAKGTWEVDGGSLRLRTIPRPVPAVFSGGPKSWAKDAALVLHVTNPAARGIASVHFTLGFDTGAPVKGYTQDSGWSLDLAEKRAPRWIELSVPIYNLHSPRFPIDLTKGNDLTFILTPNDLGTIDFTGMQIDVQPRRLVMHRNGELITFEASGANGQ